MDAFIWDDFLNLSDTTPVDQAIKKIEALQSAMLILSDDVAKNNASLTMEYKTLVGQADKMAHSIANLNIEQKEHQEIIIKETKAVEELINAAKRNVEATKANETSANDLIKAEKELSALSDFKYEQNAFRSHQELSLIHI